MKFTLSTLLLLTSIFLKGQIIPTDSTTGKFKYEQIIQADGLKQSDIYDRAKNWIVRTLKSSDNAINLDDASKSSINATGNILLSDQPSGILKYTNVVVNFKFSVYCKDGKYKVIIDNFILNYFVNMTDGSRPPRTTSLEDGYKKEGLMKGKKATEKTYAELDEKLKKMLADLKSTVISNKLPGDKGDW
jgi:Domain of unknown function (DUF4468) with TBP-like fold